MSALTTESSIAGVNRVALGAALLRVTMGVYFIAHGLLKVVVFTPAGTAGYFDSIGLPGVLAYPTILLELLGGLALILGYRTRIVSLALVPVLIGAAWFGHGSAGFFFSNPNGGWEYPVFWAVALVVQALIGSGAFALDRDA